MSDEADEIGVIIPPPDFREVIDKTAEFVAKNGLAFEEKILRSGQGSAKFSFLKMDDPYHAYYKKYIQDIQSAKASLQPPTADDEEKPTDNDVVEEDEEVVDQQMNTTETVTRKIAITTPLMRATKSVDMQRAPPEFEFLTEHPNHLPAVDIDIIKLTAQYTAVSGRQFLSGLTNREHKNPQFDFLRANHALFGYFTRLVKAYNTVLKPLLPLRTRLGEMARDKNTVLDRAVHRLEHRRVQKEKHQRAQEADLERAAYYQIDWQDFVLVETITFDDDDDEADAPPAAVPAPDQSAPPADDDDDMDVDMEDDMEVEAAPAPQQTHAHRAGGGVVTMHDDDEGEITVRTNYVPRVGGQAQPAVRHFVDPRTGRSIPIEQASEHMRVELMDPKWAEERAKALEKQKITPFAPGDAVAQNLARMASQHPDIAGSAANGGGGSARPQPVQWDGVGTSAAGAEARAQQAHDEAVSKGYDPDAPSGPRRVEQGPGVPDPKRQRR